MLLHEYWEIQYTMLVLSAALALGFSGPLPALYCPATLEKITGNPTITVEYGGILFGTCCAGCGNPLVKNPRPLLLDAIKAKRTVGTFIYDPVTGMRIDGAKAPEYTDYASIRYFFNSKDEKKTFLANPKNYVSDVKIEAYFCPVTKVATDWDHAAAFADFHGIRYFLADAESWKKFKAGPASYIENAASETKEINAVIVKK